MMKDKGRFARLGCCFPIVLAACWFPAVLAGQPPNEEAQDPPSLTLSPAVIMVKAKPGQTISQELTLWNNTGSELSFEMQAMDVVVRDGKRVFVPAGELEKGIARFASFTNDHPVALPRSSVTTRVTLTLPASPEPRAIACTFMGKTVVGESHAVQMTASLGTLFTFTLADDYRVQKDPLQVSVDQETRTILFRERLKNTGSDPIVPKGVVAVTNEVGSLVARVPIKSQRLLPGESLEFSAEHPGLPRAGNYRATFLVEHESALVANAADFTVK
jgi:hypothetical protein